MRKVHLVKSNNGGWFIYCRNKALPYRIYYDHEMPYYITYKKKEVTCKICSYYRGGK